MFDATQPHAGWHNTSNVLADFECSITSFLSTAKCVSVLQSACEPLARARALLKWTVASAEWAPVAAAGSSHWPQPREPASRARAALASSPAGSLRV
jgi:hypothetical protein